MNTSTNRTGKLRGAGPVRVFRNTLLFSTDFGVFIDKPIDTPVTLLFSTEPDSDRYVWHQVQFDGPFVGWVRDDGITIFPDENPSLADTLLYFETNFHEVRVYNEGSGISMNVFNKRIKETEVSSGEATRLLTGGSVMETFLTTHANRNYSADFEPFGKTHLRITDRVTGRDIQPIEPGFGARGTEYQAN